MNDINNVDDNNDNINTDIIDIIKTRMDDTLVFGFINKYIFSRIYDMLKDVDFLENKRNIKFLIIGLILLSATSLIGLLSYFLYHIIFLISSLKCLLWLFECYDPLEEDKIEDNKLEDNKKNKATEILEYQIIAISITLFLYPLTYIPIPMLSLCVYIISILLSSICIVDESHRQKICIIIKNIFVDAKTQTQIQSNKAKAGEFHKIIKNITYIIECLNKNIHIMFKDPYKLLEQLENSKSFDQVIDIITTGIISIKNNKLNLNENIYNETKNNSDAKNNDESYTHNSDSDNSQKNEAEMIENTERYIDAFNDDDTIISAYSQIDF